MAEEKVYVVLMDYADENCDEIENKILGVYRSMESAKKRFEELKNELLCGDTWEADAYKDFQENGEDEFGVDESKTCFCIYRMGYYDTCHTCYEISTQDLLD